MWLSNSAGLADNTTRQAPAIRGVNLGGWLVLEKWITPSLFADTIAVDEFTFYDTMTPDLAARLYDHQNTFITESDFMWLAKHGMQAVRLPVGYGVFGDQLPYNSTIEWVDKAFRWAQASGLKILLDLHTAPGSQNGNQESGRIGPIEWPYSPTNFAITLEVLTKLAERYRNHSSLLGIELLNEPHPSIRTDYLENFYETAYRQLRDICSPDNWIIFSDSFKPRRWKRRLNNLNHQHLYIDSHQYQAYTARDKRLQINGHIAKTIYLVNYRLRATYRHHPTIIGEWSLALDPDSLHGLSSTQSHAAHRAYGAAQLLVFEQASAWFFWTYRTENRIEWSFRDCVETGLLPSTFKNSC